MLTRASYSRVSLHGCERAVATHYYSHRREHSHSHLALVGRLHAEAKRLSHMYYDVKRAKSAEEIWHKPIFRPLPPEPEEGKEDKPVPKK